MTTTKSFYSLTINALIRLRGITVIYAMASLLLYPLQVYFNLHQNPSYGSADYIGDYAIYPILSYVLYLALISLAAIVLPLFASSYMHKKQSAILFHSLPVSRRRILFANFTATLIAYTIPMILSYLISGIIFAFNSDIFTSVSNLPLAFISEFGESFVTGLILISLTFLCATLASSSFDTFVLAAGFSVIIPCLYYLHAMVMNTFLFGFTLENNYLIFTSSPVINRFEMQNINYEKFDFLISPYIIYVLLAVAFMFLAILFYNKRKTEFAENQNLKAPIYKIVVVIVVFIISIIGTFISFGFSLQKDYSNIFSTFAFAFVCAICICAIFSRNFKQNKHTITTISIAVVLPVVYMLTIFGGWFNYEEKIPEASDVKTVTVSMDTFYSYGQTLELKTEENIQDVIDIHELYIENKDVVSDTYSYTNFTVEYKLNNGSVIYRSYCEAICEEQMDLFVDINDSDEVKMLVSPYQLISSATVTLSITDALYDNETYLSLEDDDKESLVQAIMADDFNSRSEEYYSGNGEVYSIINLDFGNNTKYFYVSEQTPETLACLNELGFDFYTQSQLPENLAMYIVEFSDKFNGYTYGDSVASNCFRNDTGIEYMYEDNYDYYFDNSEEVLEENFEEVLSQVSTYVELGTSKFLLIYQTDYEFTEEELLNYEAYGIETDTNRKLISVYALNEN